MPNILQNIFVLFKPVKVLPSLLMTHDDLPHHEFFSSLQLFFEVHYTPVSKNPQCSNRLFCLFPTLRMSSGPLFKSCTSSLLPRHICYQFLTYHWNRPYTLWSCCCYPNSKKKTGLDPNDNNNLHPISNLPFSFGDSDMKRKNSFHVIVAKNEVIRLANHQHGDWKVTD